mgnify:CR=1 FL=1
MIDDEDNLSIKSDVVKVKSSYVVKVIFARFFKSLLMILLMLFVFYWLSIVTTVVRFVPTTNMGIILTKDPTVKMGNVPVRTDLLVSMTSNNNLLATPWSKIRLAAMPNANTAKMKVLTRSDGRLIMGEGSVLTYDGKKIGTTIPKNMPKTGWLGGSYLLECESGACHNGGLYVMSPNSFLGQVIGENNHDKIR